VTQYGNPFLPVQWKYLQQDTPNNGAETRITKFAFKTILLDVIETDVFPEQKRPFVSKNGKLNRKTEEIGTKTSF
jgi:hypothetical protein